MGDGGWRRIDAPASRHILTLLSTQASGASRLLLGPIRKGGAPSAPLFPFTTPDGRGLRQRGQKRCGALRYSITVTLRRIRI